MQVKRGYVRLSLMMALQFFIPGTYLVTLATYQLQTLQFSGTEVGLIYGTFAIGGVFSPFISGVLADRFFRLEHLLALSYGLGGLCMFACSYTQDFLSFYLLILLYQLCIAPSFGLSASMVFHHVHDSQKEFPRIRVWGTIGWILAGLLVGFLEIESTAIPMRISALGAIIASVYALSLPATPPASGGRSFHWRQALGLDALKAFRQPGLLILVVVLLLLSFPTAFYHSFANPFFNEIGMQNAAGKMTLGQITEIGVMLSMPWLFARVKIRYVLLAGILIWAIRYGLFSWGDLQGSSWMFFLGIALHGPAYSYTNLTAQILVDRLVPPSIRSSAQGLMSLVTMGLGRLGGSFLAGGVVQHYALSGGRHQWPSIWAWPAAMALVVGLLYVLWLLRLRWKTGL